MSRTNPVLRRQARYIDPEQLQRGRENADVRRAETEHNQQQGVWNMAKRDRSPMGFKRVDTRAAEEGFTAYGDLNARLDEALDEIDAAMKRGRLASDTGGATDDDLRRSAALRNRKAGA